MTTINSIDSKFSNGDIVKDEVTNFEGLVMATTLWLNGCFRYVVQPQKIGKDGQPVEAREFDEKQLKLVKAGKFVGNHDLGGPRPSVSER